MDALLIAAAVVLGCAAALTGLAFLARRLRRRGATGQAIGAAMAAYDEAMNAGAHQTFVEMEAQRDRKHVTPALGDE